jgi:hypothetical protein
MIGSIVHLALEGAHLNALLVAVIEHRLCQHLAVGPATVTDLSVRAAIAERACQAVADGMVGLRLWNVAGGVYSNTKAAEKWLLPSSPHFVGNEHAGLFRAWLPMLSRVSSLVGRGEPACAAGSAELLEFWALLTPMLARKGAGVVRDAIVLLELEDRRGRRLDRLLARHDNLLTDTSGVDHAVLGTLLRRIEHQRIVFGSDALYHPMWKSVVQLACALEGLGCDVEESFIAIASTNARRHLRFTTGEG